MNFTQVNHEINSSPIIKSNTGHRCSKAGCGQVLVIDGNLKNHRAVCAATDAGYIEYCGLPGSIKSGCTNTPLQKSRFCEIHKPRTLVTPGESLNSVIEMILEKKTLRSHNLYKVCHKFKSFRSALIFCG